MHRVRQLNVDNCIRPRPPKPRDCYGRGAERLLRARVSGRLLWNTAFQTQHSPYTQELNSAVTACARPAQNQASQNPSMDGASLTKSHPWLRNYWQLMAIGKERNTASERLLTVQAGPPPMHTLVKKKGPWSWEEGGREGYKIEFGMDLSKHCIHA